MRGSHRWWLGRVLAPGGCRGQGCCWVHALASPAHGWGAPVILRVDGKPGDTCRDGCGAELCLRSCVSLGKQHALSGLGKERISTLRSQLPCLGLRQIFLPQGGWGGGSETPHPAQMPTLPKSLPGTKPQATAPSPCSFWGRPPTRWESGAGTERRRDDGDSRLSPEDGPGS